MIALESFKRFTFIDVFIILFFAGLWFFISFFFSLFLTPQFSYILSLFLATILMSLTVHVVRKAGVAISFYTLGALFTSRIDDIGVVGLDKIIVFFLAGVLFELLFLIFKLEFKHLQLDIIIGTALSSATIPLTMGILLSFTVTTQLLGTVINLMLLSFFIGLAGSVVAFLLWYHLRTTKNIVRFEYGQ